VRPHAGAHKRDGKLAKAFKRENAARDSWGVRKWTRSNKNITKTTTTTTTGPTKYSVK
jgi:hypothetical protein